MSQKTYRVSLEIKQEILRKLKTENISVKELAANYGISEGTIYSWLKKKVSGVVSMRDHLKVVKENQHLKELLGQTLLSMSMEQKKG
jgi:transposase-like protein